MQIIWLASYPRSGNTLLRTILWQCFGLRSASIYPNDLGGNRQLEDYVGHIEHGPDGDLVFPANSLPLVKTHDYAHDDNPAIYVIRDGRAATVSFWEFYGMRCPLQDVIEGRHGFLTWSDHIRAWNPWERPNTLLLRYEDMCDNLPNLLKEISSFLKREVLTESIPAKSSIAGEDGKWVRQKSDWRAHLNGPLLQRFNQINREMLEKGGYWER